jgi:AbrB family looped-hinge helix DNA binding protein
VTRAKITSKGQITIPKSVRDSLGLRSGDEVEFAPDRRGFRLEKILPASPFGKYRGYLKALAGSDPDALVEQMRGR